MVPVWFQLPKLPLHFFHKEALFQIAGVVGIPLLVDAATMAVSRPNMGTLSAAAVVVPSPSPFADEVAAVAGLGVGGWRS